MSEEFAENARILQADVATNQASFEAGNLWAKAMLGEIDIRDDSLVQLFLNSKNSARFDPVTGVLQSLLAGGDLSIIENTELRRVIAGWPDRAEEARNTANNVNIQRAMYAIPLVALEPRGERSPGEEALIRLEALRSDGGSFQLQGLLAYVDSVQAMIAREMAR